MANSNDLVRYDNGDGTIELDDTGLTYGELEKMLEMPAVPMSLAEITRKFNAGEFFDTGDDE